MTRRVLIPAFKFPDVIVPGGSTRLEKLLGYLPERWEAIVVSVRVPEEALTEPVHRRSTVTRTHSHYGTFARAYRTARTATEQAGAARGIEIVRRLKNLVTVPDDAILWWPFAWPAALAAARRHRPDLVFASGPPFSGLLLGAFLARTLGVPLAADVRDDWAGNPMAGPRNLTQSLTEFPMERWLVGRAARVAHVTEASVELYRKRYPEFADRMVLLRNGYDEAEFEGLDPVSKPPGRLRLLHTGSLKDGRSPAPLLRAMARLRQRDERFGSIRFTQIGLTHSDHVHDAAGMDVEWVERLPRREAVARMAAADALVLVPTPTAPTAIPAKAYEYLRTGKPILVIGGASEATRFLGDFRGVRIHAPGDVDGIAACLEEWFDAADPAGPDPDLVRPHSRQAQAVALADLFDEVVAQ